MRALIFVCTQRSDNVPPMSTPKKEDIAIEIVAIGPAVAIGTFKLVAKSVGNQFLVPQPGKLDAIK